MKKKTIAKTIRLIINWVAVLYVAYRAIIPGIELYNKYGWIGPVVWVLVIISLLLVVIAAFKLLTHLDKIADEKENGFFSHQTKANLVNTLIVNAFRLDDESFSWLMDKLNQRKIKIVEKEPCHDCGKTLREQLKGCNIISCYRQHLK